MLKGKFAVVTGAGSGIGAAIAAAFVREEVAGVAIVDYNYEAACKTAEKLGSVALPVKCDISRYEDVAAAAQLVLERFGRVDILVNNAGITRDAMFHKMPIEQFNMVISTNLLGAVNWSSVLINGMRKQEYGRIVNISSTSIRGVVGQTNYAAAKAGLVGFSRSLAKESARKNITVNCVAPGATMTDMYLSVPPEVLQAQVSTHPMGRLAQPSEIAEMVTFLASERASYVNGECICVSGGK